MRTYCSGQTKDGRICRAPAMPGDTHCINHSENPEIQALKRSVTSRGGKSSTAWKPVRRNQMKRIEDVTNLLDEVVRKCASGDLPPRVASAVASAAGQLLKGLEIVALKDRLESLEKEVSSLRL